jgi:putative DNA primase/helicase
MADWLSAVAAALTHGDRRFKARGVLTLQGGQGIGKTTWIAMLLPAGPMRNDFVKLDHHLDGANKDSIIGAIQHFIVEIGELDSSFKKDVARLKGFLTSDCDKLRRPYARGEAEYPRRTVFAATVNDETFLVDTTGNSRFWTIAVERLDYVHTIDMQQVFAQLAVDWQHGAKHWLTADEDAALEEYNLRHRTVSAIGERVRDHIRLDLIGTPHGKYMTANQVLDDMKIGNPTNAQSRECGAMLRELLGPPKCVQGRMQWRIPEAEPAKYKYPGAVQTDPDEVF